MYVYVYAYVYVYVYVYVHVYVYVYADTNMDMVPPPKILECSSKVALHVLCSFAVVLEELRKAVNRIAAVFTNYGDFENI